MNSFVRLWSLRRILKKGRLIGCLILLALVVAPLVCALIFSQSMISGITNKYIYLSDGHIQIESSDSDEIKTNSPLVLSMDTVKEGYALVYSSSATTSLMIKGISQEYFNEKRLAQITFETQTLEKSNLHGIAISRATAQALSVSIGDRVALMIVPDDSEKSPRPVLVRVEAIFHSGYDQLDKLLSFVDFDYAKTLFTSKNSTSVEILVVDEYMENLNEISLDILSSNPNISSSQLTTWDEHNVAVYNNFVTSKQMILIILLIVIVVASFYTASVAQQMIQDDMKNISISKLIGMSDIMVRRSAFLSVLAVTLSGVVFGICIGIIIGYAIGPLLSYLSQMGIPSLSFYLLDFTVKIPWNSILLISLFLLILSAIVVWITLCKTKHITPMRLFNSL